MTRFIRLALFLPLLGLTVGVAAAQIPAKHIDKGTYSFNLPKDWLDQDDGNVKWAGLPQSRWGTLYLYLLDAPSSRSLPQLVTNVSRDCAGKGWTLLKKSSLKGCPVPCALLYWSCPGKTFDGDNTTTEVVDLCFMSHGGPTLLATENVGSASTEADQSALMAFIGHSIQLR